MPVIFIYIFLLFFGFAVGSFLNVLIYRLEKGENFVSGRSHCPHCKNQIRWHDNIPLLSFLILRGRCRDCRGKISFQYPLVEAATGLLFVLIFNKLSIINDQTECFSYDFFNVSCFMFHVSWFYLSVIFSGLFAILIYDFKHYIIPNKIIYPLIAFVLTFDVLGFLNWDLFRNLKLEIRNFNSWQEIILSLIIPVFFLSLIIISRGKWMGMGDVKLALFMALFLNWPNVLVATVAAFWLGTLVSVPLVLVGKKGMQSQVPFGPFLIIGTFTAHFWGEQIVDWYLKLSLF